LKGCREQSAAPNANISHSPRSISPMPPSYLGSLRAPLPPPLSPHCHRHRHGGGAPAPPPGPCGLCCRPRGPAHVLLWVGPSPRAWDVPYCSRPSHPPSNAQGQGHRKGQHLDHPSVRHSCVGGRLSGPKLRSTAIVGGRRVCGLGGDWEGRAASPIPTVTPG